MGEVNKTNNYTEFYYHFFKNILVVSLPLLIISALIFSSSSSQAEPSHVNKDQVSLSILPSCTLSVDQSASTPHTVSILNGTYESDIGKTRVVAFCNDANGYNIYAIGYTNNEDGNTKLIGRSLNMNGGLLGNEYDINTGTAISGNTSNWAMKLTGGTGADAPVIRQLYTDYANVPDNLTMVAHRESGTHMSSSDAVGAYFDATYRAYVTSNQPAGTYNGQVKYVLDHPYNPDPLYDMEDAFYAFGNEKVYLMNDGTVHREMPVEEHGGLAGRYYAMQDMNSLICDTVEALGDNGAAQLVDMRDGKLYWVAKLKDEHCWMTQNLDLDLSHEVALTSETSDIDPESYGKTIYTAETGYTKNGNVVSWTPSTIDSSGIQRADTITMNWTSTTTARVPNWTNDLNHPYSADPGNKYRFTDPSTYNEANYTSLEACTAANNNDSALCQHGHYGNYYNWSAAVASNDTSSATSSSTWSNSICPKNWNLPTNEAYGNMLQAQNVYASGNDYIKAGDINVGFQRLITAPLYFARFGHVGSSLTNLGDFGYYSSNMVNSFATIHLLTFNDSNIYPNNKDSYNRRLGHSVRCMTE